MQYYSNISKLGSLGVRTKAEYYLITYILKNLVNCQNHVGVIKKLLSAALSGSIQQVKFRYSEKTVRISKNLPIQIEPFR